MTMQIKEVSSESSVLKRNCPSSVQQLDSLAFLVIELEDFSGESPSLKGSHPPTRVSAGSRERKHASREREPHSEKEPPSIRVTVGNV